ncbi:tape measure protein [Leifsonia sp. AG29]|uniref:tape measure protein n=1 Tax=Leifsonia sp. AG29 TaxID=2598860 RepID=UPI00131BC5C2|nr:tape measure protein [Leifsonia sp. AG29]
MSNVGYATLTIIPSAKDFSKALSGEVGSDFEKVGRDGGQKVGGGLLGGLKGFVAPAAALLATVSFGGLIREAAQASDATQKFGSTLQFAGIADSQIKALTASTQDYANKTVYGIADIQNITAQLASNGVPGFDRLAEAAGNLNAIAGGTAETYKSVGMVLTQTAGQGKLTTENWNQLSDAIPGASGKLQQALLEAGAYTGNFRDAMAKGEITATEFNDAILKLGFDPVAVSAARSTSTIEGALGNLQASAVTALSGLITFAKPAITGFLGGVADGISGATTFVSGFFQSFSSGAGSLGGLIPQVLQLASAFSPLSLVVRAAGPQLAQLATAVGGLLSAALNTLLPPLTSVSSTFVELLSGVLSGVLPALTAFTGWITGNLPWLTAIAAGIGGIVIAMQAYQLIMGIVRIATGAWAAIQAVLNVALSANPIGIVVMAVAALVAAIIWVATQTTFFKDVWAAVSSFLVDTWNNIASFAATVWNGIVSFISGAWNAIVSTVAGQIAAVQSTIAAVLGAISSAWSATWNAIGSFLSGVWNGIVSGVSNGINSIVNFFSGLGSKILGVLAGAGQWLLDVGKNLIQGFLDGVNNAWKWVEKTIRGLFGGAVDLVKGILGIHSPSRVFREVGRFTGEGFALGLEDMAGRIEDASAVLQPTIPDVPTSSALGIAEGGVFGASGRGGDTYVDFEYTQVGGQGLTAEQELRRSAQRLKQAIRK